jgi:hypothetical protein
MQGDLLLLGPDQQLAIGKVPEVEAEEVEAVVDVDDPGLGLAQLQPAAGEESVQARDDVAFEDPREGAVTTKSSAYRMRLMPRLLPRRRQGVMWRPSGRSAPNRRSMPSSAILASRGEITP